MPKASVQQSFFSGVRLGELGELGRLGELGEMGGKNPEFYLGSHDG